MKEALHEILRNNLIGEEAPNLLSPKVSFFNVAELNEKLKVCYSDILLVTTDDSDRRNKLIWLKGKTKEYTLMNVGFTELLENTNTLLMVNKSTLINMEAMRSYRYDFITLENLFPGWNNKQIILGRTFRKSFYSLINK